MKTKITIKIPRIKQRFTWGFNPVTRVKLSKKIYWEKTIKLKDGTNLYYPSSKKACTVSAFFISNPPANA